MNTWQEKISRTGFFTSVVSYVGFWILDAWRPGFVARYLSVHIFLLAAIVFGTWWSLTVQEYRDWPFFQYAVVFLLGILCAWITWQTGTGFESYRLLAVVGALFIPSIVLSLIRVN